MIRDIRVEARQDHIASLANASPLAALEELIWNALDADASEVKVDLVSNGLGAVDAIRVSDNGSGVDVSRVDDTFGGLGGSWKRTSDATASLHRRLHGRHGRGRFKAFALGGLVEWRTTCETDGARASWVIAGDVEQPGLFRLSSVEPGVATGTEVYVTNVRASADALSDAGTTVAALAAKFALYLMSYPSVHIYYCGLPVTPVIVQKTATEYTVRIASGASAQLRVIEWRRRFVGAGRLVLCGGDGFALREVAAGTRPGPEWPFTAYLVSPRFGDLENEGMLVMDELHPEVRAYLDGARKILRDHFKVRLAEADGSRAAAWIAEGSYPFAAEDASARRQAFDVAAEGLRANVEGFDALPAASRRYLFDLLLRAQKAEA